MTFIDSLFIKNTFIFLFQQISVSEFVACSSFQLFIQIYLIFVISVNPLHTSHCFFLCLSITAFLFLSWMRKMEINHEFGRHWNKNLWAYFPVLVILAESGSSLIIQAESHENTTDALKFTELSFTDFLRIKNPSYGIVVFHVVFKIGENIDKKKGENNI